MTEEQIERVEEIKDDIKDLVEELKGIARKDNSEYARQAISGIETALDNDHEWLGKNMYTIQGWIDESHEEIKEEQDDNHGVHDGES